MLGVVVMTGRLYTKRAPFEGENKSLGTRSVGRLVYIYIYELDWAQCLYTLRGASIYI